MPDTWQRALGACSNRFDDCIHFAEAPLCGGYGPRTQIPQHWLAGCHAEALWSTLDASWCACSIHRMVDAQWTALGYEHLLPLPLPACLPA